MTRTKAERLSNWSPVNDGAEFVPVAVVVCVWVESALPVKVGALTEPVAVVMGLTPVEVFAVINLVLLVVEAAVTALPVKVGAELVPLGVPALTAEEVTELPVKVGADTEPVGVMLSFPPVVPMLPLAFSVPTSVLPFSAETSV